MLLVPLILLFMLIQSPQRLTFTYRLPSGSLWINFRYSTYTDTAGFQVKNNIEANVSWALSKVLRARGRMIQTHAVTATG